MIIDETLLKTLLDEVTHQSENFTYFQQRIFAQHDGYRVCVHLAETLLVCVDHWNEHLRRYDRLYLIDRLELHRRFEYLSPFIDIDDIHVHVVPYLLQIQINIWNTFADILGQSVDLALKDGCGLESYLTQANDVTALVYPKVEGPGIGTYVARFHILYDCKPYDMLSVSPTITKVMCNRHIDPTRAELFNTNEFERYMLTKLERKLHEMILVIQLQK